jgi:hypothetical protein
VDHPPDAVDSLEHAGPFAAMCWNRSPLGIDAAEGVPPHEHGGIASEDQHGRVTDPLEPVLLHCSHEFAHLPLQLRP